jgi:hypothetical protein
MKTVRNSMILATAFTFADCAGYQGPAVVDNVSHTQLTDTSYMVRVAGLPQTHTCRDRDYQRVLQRAAELTVDAGYSHFLVDNVDAGATPSLAPVSQGVYDHFNKAAFPTAANRTHTLRSEVLSKAQGDLGAGTAIRVVMVAAEQNDQAIDAYSLIQAGPGQP